MSNQYVRGGGRGGVSTGVAVRNYTVTRRSRTVMQEELLVMLLCVHDDNDKLLHTNSFINMSKMIVYKKCWTRSTMLIAWARWLGNLLNENADINCVPHRVRGPVCGPAYQHRTGPRDRATTRIQ